MDSLDVDGILGHPLSVVKAGRIKYISRCEMAGMGCFARVPFGERMMIEYYCGTLLLYYDLYGDKHLDRKYGEILMSVSVKDFTRYALYTSNGVKDSDRRIFPASIVLAQFIPLCFNNDFPYLKGDRTSKIGRDSNKETSRCRNCTKIVSREFFRP